MAAISITSQTKREGAERGGEKRRWISLLTPFLKTSSTRSHLSCSTSLQPLIISSQPGKTYRYALPGALRCPHRLKRCLSGALASPHTLSSGSGSNYLTRGSLACWQHRDRPARCRRYPPTVETTEEQDGVFVCTPLGFPVENNENLSVLREHVILGPTVVVDT